MTDLKQIVDQMKFELPILENQKDQLRDSHTKSLNARLIQTYEISLIMLEAINELGDSVNEMYPSDLEKWARETIATVTERIK